MRRRLAILGLGAAAVLACRTEALPPQSPGPALRTGDLVFQTSRSTQSAEVQKATRSPYSHMGMVVFRDRKPYVLEAVQTVRYTPLGDWTARGSGGHYVVKRLRDADSLLGDDGTRRLLASAERFLGRPYDLAFEWSDDRVYCSELVWKAYREALSIDLGALSKLRDFDLSDPAVRAKMKERYGTRVPLDEPVISPAAMFASERLITVVER